MWAITTGKGESDRVRAYGGSQVGGEIFAKTAKTPPLQSGVCGDIIAVRVPPIASPPCAYHAVYGDVRFLQRRGTPRRYGLREMELLD